MSLGSFARMFLGMTVVALGGVGVMRRLLVISRFGMFGGGVMMLCGVLVMFGSFTVVLRSFLRHDEYSPSQSRSHLTTVRSYQSACPRIVKPA
jgi:hypothetical protein